jgi:RNA polymerase sigma-70 factor (ECF subfamily)
VDDETDNAAFEAELIRRVALGDRSAFERIYTMYSQPLMSYAMRMVRDRMLAEEVLQDAFLRIWKHAKSYDFRLSRPFSWAVLITKRLCLDRLRRRRPPVIPESDLVREDESAPEAVDEANPRDELRRSDDFGMLHDLMASLPFPQRESLELAVHRGLTQSEIAATLNIPIGTVKTAMYRGTRRLREKLATRHD